MSRVLVPAAAVLLGATLVAQQQTPVFRSGIDVIRLDVSVFDRERRPVRGLAMADFTVIENGKPQRIVAVTEMNTADEDPTPSAWMRHVTPDVAANDLTDMAGDGRLLAIVLDDWNIPYDDHEIILSTRAVGRYLVDQLGPSDVAAVVFAHQAGKTEDFTADRQKLIAAIDKFDPPEFAYIERRPSGPGPGGGDMPQRFAPALMRTECQRGQPALPTLETVVGRLASVPNRRKTVIFVSVGVTHTQNRQCQTELSSLTTDIYRRAQRDNVNVYSIDPAGYGGFQRYLQNPMRALRRPNEHAMSQAQAEREAKLRRDFLEITADTTGGRAIVNTDDLGREIDRMLTEASSYYLVGYQTSNGEPDGKFRKIDVKVSRPSVTVRSRSGFYAPNEDGTRPKDRAPASSDLGLAGMSSAAALALRSQAVAIGPLAPGSKDVEIIVVVGVRAPGASRGAADETLTLIRTVYDERGKPGPPVQQKVSVLPGAIGGDNDLRYEVFQRLALPPGRYELRLNATSPSLDTSGSVYSSLEVPDYSRRRLALSGVLVGRKTEGQRSDPLASLLPIVPTTTREFSPAEAMVAFLRVFQGGTEPAVPVKMTVELVSNQDQKVWEESSTLPVEAFAASRSAPFEVAPALTSLMRGPYLLSITAELPDRTKTRVDLVFRVR